MKFKNTYLLEDAAIRQIEHFDENDLTNQEYEDIRIPGIVTTDNGVIVCAYELRRCYGDRSAMDLGMKVSTDFGQTWTERIIIKSGEGSHILSSPVFIPDGERLHFLYTDDVVKVFYRYTDDYGKTWSEDVELTKGLISEIPQHKWGVVAIGPGHGMKLSNGRLIAPVWFASKDVADESENKPQFCVTTVYSDDSGKSWHAGELVPDSDIKTMNESSLCELPDGRVYMSIRNENRNFNGGTRRALSISPDGISNWSTAEYDMDMLNPRCMAGMCNDDQGRIYYAGCDSPDVRMYQTLKVSSDCGKTWDKIQFSFRGGYCDIAYNKVSKTVFACYEARVPNSQKIFVTEIDVDEVILNTNLN